jgi:hypothetical protein
MEGKVQYQNFCYSMWKNLLVISLMCEYLVDLVFYLFLESYTELVPMLNFAAESQGA